jgi:hypothetical protein
VKKKALKRIRAGKPRKKPLPPLSEPALEQDTSMEDDSLVLVESPHTILDAAVSDAARTLARAAQGGEVTREELSAAQDILNRKGITNAGGRASAIPEAFARQAFAYVFRILGFPPIKWPSLSLSKKTDETDEASVDDFNRALLEN